MLGYLRLRITAQEHKIIKVNGKIIFNNFALSWKTKGKVIFTIKL
jgi:hypothetical protein